LRGPYCSQCGQAVRDARAPIVEASGIVVQQSLGTDARFWSTLISLMFKPGRLTNEFLAGKQRRSLHPIRMFVIASAIALITPDIARQEPWVRPETWIDAEYADASLRERFDVGMDRLREMKAMRVDELQPTSQELSFGVQHNKKFLVWLVLAGLLALTPVLKILRPRRLLYDHLVFVMHLGCFAYFSDFVFRLLQVRSFLGSWPQGLVQATYVTLAFRAVYAWKRPIGLPIDLLCGVLLFVALDMVTSLFAQLSIIWMAMPH